MQGFISNLLKKHAYAVILNIIGLIGLMVNLYLTSKLYPLAENDRRFEYQIQAANVRIDNERESREQNDKYIVEKMSEFQKFNAEQFKDLKDLIKQRHTTYIE